MTDDKQTKTLEETVLGIAKEIVWFDTGALARLRRMDINGPGEGEFWKLAVKHIDNSHERWLLPVKLMAQLTPKGAPNAQKQLHNKSVSFGAALVSAGYPETRLLRFLALPFDRRGEAQERMVRWIAAKGHNGLNCIDVCSLVLSPKPEPARKLAQTYYRALDRAETQSKDKETNS